MTKKNAGPPARSSSRRASGRRRAAAQEPPACDLCDHMGCKKTLDCFEERKAAPGRYTADERLLQLARAAAEVEAAHYGRAPRVEEILHFARRLKVRRLGVAFCTGLQAEARVFCDLMRPHFEVVSVCCKAGAVPKATFDMPHVHDVKRESMCNPLTQAELLNRARTGLNVLVGLCVGHDALFFKASEAPVTVLVAKDRTLAHNPAGALYCPYLLKRLREGAF